MSENEEQQPIDYDAWNKEIIDGTKSISHQAIAITDTMGFTSTLVLGVVPLSRSVRAKVIGFDGSLFELVEAAREFIKDFETGAFCSSGDVESSSEEEDA